MQKSRALTSNPVFEHDLHRLGLDTGRIQRIDRWIIILSIIGAVIVGNPSYAINPGPRGSFPASMLIAMTFLSIMASLFPIAAAVYYMFMTITSVNTEITSGQWDDIKLTTLSESEILTAKYAILQLRGHRILSVARVTGVVTALFSLVTPLFWPVYIQYSMVWGEPIASQLMPYLVSTAMSLTLAYMMPLWAMKAIIAASLYCAVRIRHVTFALLAGLIMVLVLYLILLIIQLILKIGLVELAPLAIDIGIGLAVVNLISGRIVFLYFRFIKTTALRYTLRNAFSTG